MKKTLLALVVAATAAGTVNAAEIVKSDSGTVNFYGQLRQNIVLSDADADADAAVDWSSSRAGIDASYAINDNLNLVGLVEFYVRGTFSARKHYIGFESDSFGTVTFGKNSPLSDDVYGAEYSYYYGGSDGFLYNTDMANDYFWQDNMIKYELVKDAYWVKASYNLPEKNSAPELYELFAGTSFGDLSLHAGGSVMNNYVATTKDVYTADLTTGEVTSTEETTVGNTKYTSYEVTAEYALGGSTLGATYAHIKTEVGSAESESDAISLGAMVPVADKTTAYGGYQFLDIDAEDSDKTIIYAGVEYKFASWGRTYAEYGYNKTEGSDANNGVVVGARVYW